MKSNWVLQESECTKGEYTFSGNLNISNGIKEKLSFNEINDILSEIKIIVLAYGRIEQIQIFENSEGRRILVLDNLSQTIKRLSSGCIDNFV